MSRLTNDKMRAMLKRKAPEGGKKKMAIDKRPKLTGLSIGAPAVASRPIPRVTIIPMRDAAPRHGATPEVAPITGMSGASVAARGDASPG